MTDAVQIIFPSPPLGVQNAIDTVAELRAVDSTDVNENTEVLVADVGFYKFDPSSLAADDGATVIKPTDLTSMQAGRWLLVLSGNASLVSFLPSGTGAIATTVQAKLRETVSVTDFGAVGDDATNNNTALANARAYIAATGALLRFPPGDYLITTSPNWAIQDAVIFADGDVTLRYTGMGNAVTIDGDAGDAVKGPNGCCNVTMTGFKVKGSATGNEPVLVRSISHGIFTGMRVVGGNTAKRGFLVEGGVLNTFNQPEVSANPTGAWAPGKPSGGMLFDDNAASQPSSYHRLNGPITEGPTFGIELDHALGVEIEAGTMEGHADTGLYVGPNAVNTRVAQSALESNGVDINDIGENTTIEDVDTATKVILHGQNGQIRGGTHDIIQVDAAATGSLISGARFGRSGGTITDAGTRTRKRDNLNMVSQKFANDALTETAQTVGASPFTYINTSANNVTIGIVGGTVTGVNFNPQNAVNRAMSATTSQVALRPGDSMDVIFSVAPTIFLYKY